MYVHKIVYGFKLYTSPYPLGKFQRIYANTIMYHRQIHAGKDIFITLQFINGII